MTVWAVGLGALGAEARSAARRGWSLLDEVQRIGSRSGAEPVALRAAREWVDAVRAHGEPIRFALGPGHVSAPGGVVHFAVEHSASIYPLWFGIGVRALVVHPEATVDGLAKVIEAVATSGRSTGPTATMPGPGRDGALQGPAPGVFVERADRFVEEQRRRHRAFLVPYEQIVADLVEPGFSEALSLGRSGEAAEAGAPGVGPLPLRETELMGTAIDRAVATLEGAGQDADEAALRLQSEAAEETQPRIQVTHLLKVLVRLGQQADRPVSASQLCAAMAGALEVLLAQNDTDGFQGGLRGIYAVSQAWVGKEGIAATVGRALELAVVGPMSAASVARHFERVDPAALRWFTHWFAQRGARVPAETWFSAFEGLPAGPGRQFLQRLLRARPEVDRGWWLAQARDGGSAALAEALEVLGGQALSESERSLFVPALQHPEPETRMRAAALFALDSAEVVREALGRMLLDPVRPVRQSALAALVKRGLAQDARFVAAVMRTSRFADLSTDEQARLAESLARLGGDSALRVFREMLNLEEASRLGRLFRRETVADGPVRRAAVHGLGALGTVEALALLDQVKRRGAAPLDGFAAKTIEACTAGTFARRDLLRPGTRPEVPVLVMAEAQPLEAPIDLDQGWRLIEPEAFGLTPTLSLEALLMGYLDDVEVRSSASPKQTIEPGQILGSVAPSPQPGPVEVPPFWPSATPIAQAPDTDASQAALFELPEIGAPSGQPGLAGLMTANPEAPEWGESDSAVDFGALSDSLRAAAEAQDALTSTASPEPLGPPEAEPDGDHGLAALGLAWPTPDAEGLPAPQWGEPPAAWMADASDASFWAETPETQGHAVDVEALVLPEAEDAVAPELGALLADLETASPPGQVSATSGARVKRISALGATGRLPDDLDVDLHHAGAESESMLSVGPPPLLAVAMRSLDTLPSLDTAAPAEPVRRHEPDPPRSIPRASSPRVTQPWPSVQPAAPGASLSGPPSMPVLAGLDPQAMKGIGAEGSASAGSAPAPDTSDDVIEDSEILEDLDESWPQPWPEPAPSSAKPTPRQPAPQAQPKPDPKLDAALGKLFGDES